MISFCCRSFHSLLGFPDSDDRRHAPHRWHHLLPPPDRSGLHLLAAADSPKPPHVVESPAVGYAGGGGKPSDPGAWGLHEAAAAGVGGLGLCTESLGCESFEGGTGIDDGDEAAAAATGWRATRRPVRRRRAEVRFPPPLPWMMGRGGRRSRFLRAERRDGRFVLTEVHINTPPEMLRAFRIDGRLRLEIVGSELADEEEEFPAIAGEGEVFPGIVGEEDLPAIAVEEGSDSEENGRRWELPSVRVEGQRCVEAMSGNGGEPLWWNHRFVTTA